MSGLKARRSLRAWGRRQLYSFFSSLGTLPGHRLGTAMTVLVLGIAMALPLGLFVAVAQGLGQQIGAVFEMQIDSLARDTGGAGNIGHARCGAGMPFEKGARGFKDPVPGL